MTSNEFINFSEMLTPEQLERIGISEDRPLSQCVVRALGALNDAEKERDGLVKDREMEIGLLQVAVCPDAHKSGHEEAWQCQWCDERILAIARADKEGGR